jgi:hypothetical protein
MSLQLLVDMNLSPEWIGELAKHGWTAVHWSAVGYPKADDSHHGVGGVAPRDRSSDCRFQLFELVLHCKARNEASHRTLQIRTGSP